MTYAHTNCIDCTPQRPARQFSLKHLALWAGLARQRRALANLTAAQRDDIGVTAQEAAQEAQRPIWDVPQQWRQ